MKKIKILHTADLHLDSPFEALGSGKAAVRRGEQRELLNSLADLANEENVDLVLMSGDLLDSDSAYFETGEKLIGALGRINAPVFIAPGNHDYYSPRCPYARLKLPPNVYVFSSDKLGYVELDNLGVRVYGAAFTDNYCPSMLEGFCAPRVEGIYNILCVHGQVCAGKSAYNPITEAQLATSGLDYAALGHVHTASGLKKTGCTWYSWPGCPEGRGFDETGDKFVNIIELNGSECTLTQRSIAKRRYLELNVDITDSEPLLAIHSQLPDETVRDIYRITLTGESEQAPDINRLYDNLSEMFFSLQLRDNTHIHRNIWERAGEDTLRGIFLAKLKKQYDGTKNPQERMKIEQAARWGLAALDNGEELIIHGNK